MSLYRVTLQSEILIDCENEHEAERIAYSNIEYEIGNGNVQLYSIKEITSEEQLLRAERNSLPWRSRARDREPERTVEEILRDTPTVINEQMDQPGWPFE